MAVYKLAFIDDKLVSCIEDYTIKPSTDMFVQRDAKGRLLFAFIRSNTLLDAVIKGEELIIDSTAKEDKLVKPKENINSKKHLYSIA